MGSTKSIGNWPAVEMYVAEVLKWPRGKQPGSVSLTIIQNPVWGSSNCDKVEYSCPF